MVFAALSRLARVRVTLIYAASLIVVTAVLVDLGPAVQDRVIRHASTNLHNLSHGRLGTLLGSAFVADAGPVYLWLPGLACLLGIGELLWRSKRLLLAFAVGHVGATLLVAVGLTAAVTFGWIPATVTRATDVGISYGAAAVLGALTPAIPRCWRPTWVGWWLAIGAAVVYLGTDFSDAGHAVAMLLGMVLASRFGRPRPWTPFRAALLLAGAWYGYLVLTGDEATPVVATWCGIAGAVLGTVVTVVRSVERRRTPSANGPDVRPVARVPM
jgi:hypothetical protein